MKEVFLKAEALGQALVESQAFTKMNLAEQEATQNPVVMEAAEKRNVLRAQVEALLQVKEVDRTALEAASQELKQAEEALMALPEIAKLEEERLVFANMMNQVNKLIQYALTGEMPQDSCEGSCAGCSGCGC